MFFSQYNLIISSVINFTLVSCQKISVETLPMTEGQYGVHVVAFRGVGGGFPPPVGRGWNGDLGD